jgi:hypothetical protein
VQRDDRDGSRVDPSEDAPWRGTRLRGPDILAQPLKEADPGRLGGLLRQFGGSGGRRTLTIGGPVARSRINLTDPTEGDFRRRYA